MLLSFGVCACMCVGMRTCVQEIKLRLLYNTLLLTYSQALGC